MLSLAFYTVFIGKRDNPAFNIPNKPSIKYPCYYFSNNDMMLELAKREDWIPVYIPIELKDDAYFNSFESKNLKVSPHLNDILNKFDYTCYLDSKLGKQMIWGEMVDFGRLSQRKIELLIFDNFILKDKAMILRNHVNIPANIWCETWDSMLHERYLSQKDKIFKYVDMQLDNGLKEVTNIHLITGFIIRNMKHPKINKLNSTWAEHIKLCGTQCQISFFFVKQLFEDIIVGIDDVFENTYIPKKVNPEDYGITLDGIMKDLKNYRNLVLT